MTPVESVSLAGPALDLGTIETDTVSFGGGTHVKLPWLSLLPKSPGQWLHGSLLTEWNHLAAFDWQLLTIDTEVARIVALDDDWPSEFLFRTCLPAGGRSLENTAKSS